MPTRSQHTRKRRDSGSRRYPLTPAQRHTILQRDQFQCQRPDCPYSDCGTPTNPLTIDHIVPRSHGGTDEPTNLRTMCHRSNSSRRDGRW